MKKLSKLFNFIIKENEELLYNKNGKKFINEYVKLLKNNNFLHEVYNLNNDIHSSINLENKFKEEYINGVIDVFNSFDKKNIKESFTLVDNLVEKYFNNDLKEKYNDFLLENSKYDILLDAFGTLITEKKNCSNLPKIIEARNIIKENLEFNTIEVISEEEKLLNEIDPDVLSEKLIHIFNTTFQNKLNEEETKLFKILIETKDINQQNKVINELNKSCIESVNSFLSNCTDLVIKEKLLTVKEKLLNEENSLSFYERVLKLVERKEILDELRDEE